MTYNELVLEIKNCPATWIGALLIVVLKRAAQIPVFNTGGLEKLAGKIERENTP